MSLHSQSAAEMKTTAEDLRAEKIRLQRHGHKGIISMDPKAKMEAITTFTATYIPPKSPGVRLRGIRSERLEKHVTDLISQKVKADFEAPIPKMSDFCTTTRADFCANGFVPAAPQPTQGLDYRTDQAITFWSENYHLIEGVTPVHTLTAPFRKSAKFSTPIGERQNDLDLPAES